MIPIYYYLDYIENYDDAWATIIFEIPEGYTRLISDLRGSHLVQIPKGDGLTMKIVASGFKEKSNKKRNISSILSTAHSISGCFGGRSEIENIRNKGKLHEIKLNNYNLHCIMDRLYDCLMLPEDDNKENVPLVVLKNLYDNNYFK